MILQIHAFPLTSHCQIQSNKYFHWVLQNYISVNTYMAHYINKNFMYLCVYSIYGVMCHMSMKLRIFFLICKNHSVFCWGLNACSQIVYILYPWNLQEQCLGLVHHCDSKINVLFTLILPELKIWYKLSEFSIVNSYVFIPWIQLPNDWIWMYGSACIKYMILIIVLIYYVQIHNYNIINIKFLIGVFIKLSKILTILRTF